MEYILPIYLATATPNMVVSKAKELVGTHYAPGVTAQCANFVRFVFRSCGLSLPSVSNPSDMWLIPSEPIGPGYANSFAGQELGPVVKLKHIQPGDIVMYQNTYGGWPCGVITHVGIYVGEGKIVHRPTSEGTVKITNLKYATINQIRRPKQFITDYPDPKPTPVF